MEYEPIWALFFKVLSLNLEARIGIRICIKVRGRIQIRIHIKVTCRIWIWIRTRIKVMRIRKTSQNLEDILLRLLSTIRRKNVFLPKLETKSHPPAPDQIILMNTATYPDSIFFYHFSRVWNSSDSLINVAKKSTYYRYNVPSNALSKSGNTATF